MVNKCSADKENVPLALAVIHETTITEARSYFPNRRDVASFLEMFNTWWTISNPKKKDFLQIYWEYCDQWGQKNCVFKSSGRLD